MVTPVAVRVEKRRSKLRMAGLRPVQIWAPDRRRSDFAAECKRQSHLSSQADRTDADMSVFMDEALADMNGLVS